MPIEKIKKPQFQASKDDSATINPLKYSQLMAKIDISSLQSNASRCIIHSNILN